MTEQEFVLRLLSTESGFNSCNFEDAKKLYKEIVKETSDIELSQKTKIDAVIEYIETVNNRYGLGVDTYNDLKRMMEELKND